MTILPDHEITALGWAGLVEPFDPALVNPASLDLRLGNLILIEAHQDDGWVPYDLAAQGHSQASPYELRPGQFILAETMETFKMPSFMAGQFLLKSSRAREGLQHLMAGYADPGWNGSRLTLELKNIRQLHNVRIWPGMRIGQMVFHRLESEPLFSYALVGRYNNDPQVTASKG